jgi:hypothetical protein
MKKIKVILTLLAITLTGMVHAQPGHTVGSVSGQSSTDVDVTVNYLGTTQGTATGVVGFQATINFDDTKLDIAPAGLAACQALFTCTDNGSSISIVGFTFPSAEIPPAVYDISFSILPAAIIGDVLPLTLSNEEYVDTNANVVPINGSSDGQVTVVAGPQPDYSSNPTAGTTLALNGNVGGANPTSSVVISNVGPAGAPALTGSCLISGVDSASFSFTTGSAINIAQGANQTVTVDCDASSVTAATLNASLDCTHNGDGSTTASPANYPLTCDIAAISPNYDSTPVVGTTLPLGQILQGGANPATSITINNDNGDLTTTLTGTCSIGAPFSITSGANFSVAQGAAAATVGIDCDSSAVPNVYNDSLSCTHNGSNTPSPATYPVSCEVLAAAAAGSQNPADGTTINIIAPPGGSEIATVNFSEVGGQGVAINDLNCSLAIGADFAITSPTFPATVPAAGNLDVVVTFTPLNVAPFSDTLDCTYTDGTGAVSVSYPLTGDVRAVVVPTLGVMGYTIMMFGLLLVGFFGMRRKA